MRVGLVTSDSPHSDALSRSRDLAIAARRRAYNRAYMRAWRADPRHRMRERATRQHAYYARKLRDALRERRPFTDDYGRSVCGLCGKLPPVYVVSRLRICDHAHGGYVSIRIPYCGEC
jgi:hypothetical protein